MLPHQPGLPGRLEEQVGRDLLVDVTDEPPVDAEADELLQSGENRRTVSTGSPSCWFSCCRR